MSRFGARVRGSQSVSTWLRGGGAGVQSVQRGTITIGAAATSNTATITTVDTTRSVVHLLGFSATGSSGTEWRDYACRIALTNATTVTATRATATEVDSVLVVSYEVVQFNPGMIRSIQRGTIANSGTTATISAVNMARTTLMMLGYSYDGGSSFAAWLAGQPRVVLTNATTVTATSGGTAFTVGYQVVEWY